jgi:hypothetical protein
VGKGREMKTYRVTCEGVVERDIVVSALSAADAIRQGKREFAALTGVTEKGVAFINIEEAK